MQLTEHKTNPLNERITITPDERDPESGASREYTVTSFEEPNVTRTLAHIDFHRGPLSDGVNGVTFEVLAAIMMDRLRGLQSGPRACPENNEALIALELTMSALRARTAGRMARGVEGTNQV